MVVQERRDLGPRPIMRDPEREAQLRRDGYAVFDLVDPSTVDRLREVYEAVGTTPGDPGLACHATFLSYDVAYKREVAARVGPCIAGEIDAAFDGYRVLLGSFIVKWPGPHSGFGLHQDLTFVDERRYASYVVWIPLDDVSLEDGPLWVAPRSHLWRLDPRGLHDVPFTFLDVAERVAERHCVPVPVRRGQVLVFDNNLIHASTPNTSGAPRVVVGAQIVPDGVPVVQYYGREDGSVAEVPIEDDRIWFESRPLVTWEPIGAPGGPSAVLELGPQMDLQELEELEREGLAPRAPGPGPGPINAPHPVCFRCGGPAEGHAPPSPWVGNVTLLCDACANGERASVQPSLQPPAVGPVLVDPVADLDLRTEGYAVIDVPEVRDLAGALAEAYLALRPHGQGMECDMVIEDEGYRRAASDLLARTLDDLAASLFVGYEPFLRNFLTKWPGSDSDLYLHRDWMYVDESGGDRTYVVWIPLQDIGPDDGPLQVLPRSHRVDLALRGSHLNSPWVHDDESVRPRLDTVTNVVGDVVVFDNALVHCSPPNLGNGPRVVAAVALRPVGAELVHHRRNDDGTATCYEIDEDFLITITPQEMLDAPLDRPVRAVLPLEAPVPSPAEAAQMLDAAAPRSPQ